MKKKKTTLSQATWIIAVLLTAFIPYCVVAIFVRAAFEKRLHQLDRDDILGPACGLLLWGIFELVLVFLFTKGTGDAWLSAIFALPLIGGIFMLILRRRVMKHDDKLRLCIVVVAHGHVTDLQHIAECLSTTVEGAIALVKEVKEKQFLKNCTVDAEKGELIVNAPWANVRYRCEHCGAAQIITHGVNVVCEYCGAPIE